jgi:hypothetical protein
MSFLKVVTWCFVPLGQCVRSLWIIDFFTEDRVSLVCIGSGRIHEKQFEDGRSNVCSLHMIVSRAMCSLINDELDHAWQDERKCRACLVGRLIPMNNISHINVDLGSSWLIFKARATAQSDIHVDSLNISWLTATYRMTFVNEFLP